MTTHLFIQCTYAKRVWTLVAAWSPQNALDPTQWAQHKDAMQWWTMRLLVEPATSRMGQASLIILVLWQI